MGHIMPRKISLLFVSLFALAIPGYAQAETACPPAFVQPTAEMQQAAIRNARDHGFLWRISKDGRTSYLYGTIHAAKYNWLFPGQHVAEAMKATDTEAVEIDMMDPAMQARTTKALQGMPTTALPGPLALRMQKRAKAVCVPYDSIAKLPPIFQVETLSLMEGRRDGLEAAYSVDVVLAAVGHAAKKNVVSLETPESQLDLLQMPNPQDAIALVEDDLGELETGEGRAYLKRISRYWEESNYDEMSHFEKWCRCLDTDAKRKLMKSMLDDRNPALADRIDALHASGKQVFTAVGSLHMFGPLGLPTLMEKRGYKVERIDWKAP
jgi:uncharacterized protein YbaP (TraB family)